MTIAIVGTSSASGSFSSLSVPVPSGVQEDDLVLLGAVVDAGLLGSNAIISPPSGFSAVLNSSVWFQSSNRSRIELFYKAASAGESGNYDLTFGGGGFPSWSSKAVCRVIRGNKMPLGASANDSDGSGSASSLDAPSVTADEAVGLLVCLWGAVGGSVSVSQWPPGVTDVLEVAGSGNAELMIAQQQLALAGPTDIKTLTISASRPWAAVSLIVNASGVILPLWENF